MGRLSIEIFLFVCLSSFYDSTESLVAMTGVKKYTVTKTMIKFKQLCKLGLGLSVVVPEIFRLAGRNNTLSASDAISTVSGIGFIGFMIGPVLLGIIAKASSLTNSYIGLLFTIIVALIIVIAFFKKKY